MKKLGEGGFGSVFQAMRGAEPVAVKFLNRADEEALSFFAREARNLYRLISNPHVVRLIEYNDANTPPFIAMEYCVGGSLISWVTNVRPWPEVVAAMLHACAGLSEIHRLGGFHRDIKPENMLLSTDGNAWVVKLGDLGLARIPTDDSSMTQRAAGTRAYMAPELFAKQPYTSASDIYSLGITTCELLTGSRDLDSLSALAIPEPLRKLILQMTTGLASSRPSIQVIATELSNLLTPQRAKPAPEDTDWTPLILAGLALGTLVLIAKAAK